MDKQITSPIKAIREKCLECSGSRNEVKACNVTGCALYAFRLGKNPYRTKRELSEEQRQAARERFAAYRNKQSNNNEIF